MQTRALSINIKETDRRPARNITGIPTDKTPHRAYLDRKGRIIPDANDI